MIDIPEGKSFVSTLASKFLSRVCPVALQRLLDVLNVPDVPIR